MQFKDLYRQGQNFEIQIWKIWRDGNVIYTESGVLWGKVTQKSRTIVPDNDKFSASEQADLIAQTLWDRQVSHGYYPTIQGTIENTTKELLKARKDK